MGFCCREGCDRCVPQQPRPPAYTCEFCTVASPKDKWGPGRITCPICHHVALSPADRELRQAIVATGKCPQCGRPLRRNWVMTGWWQCVQLGAVGFREDSTQPPCNWQGFVE
jgi:hypothetical protein